MARRTRTGPGHYREAERLATGPEVQQWQDITAAATKEVV